MPGRLAGLSVVGSLFCSVTWAQTAGQPTLQNAPPVVVKSEPQAGLPDIEPGRREISVTFSKPMRDGDWSWVQLSKESFPAKTGEPHFLPDQRTCVLPVTLEPGKTYAVGINLPPYQHFQDQEGRKALPYVIVFTTR